MDDSCQNEKRKLDKRDILDAVLTTISLVAFLWWMGWFPFNGFFDDLLGKKQQAQPEQAAVQPEQNAPGQPKIAPPASFEEVAKACVVLRPKWREVIPVAYVIKKRRQCAVGVCSEKNQMPP